MAADLAGQYAERRRGKAQLAQVDAAARKWMPDVEDPNNLFVAPEWWDTRVEGVTRRFKEWHQA
ncbi:MAG: hypothetical protein IT562_09940 [Alphaproteobacteria bacterium]|nr:hypothetical protein [Alphaproteobacteria bacterium]